MAHTTHFESRDQKTVEDTWQRFVPSAELLDVDPAQFRFNWRSAEVPGLSIIRYDLAAEVRSVVEPEDQILVCRVDTKDGSVDGPFGALAAAQPWITGGDNVTLRIGDPSPLSAASAAHWERTFDYALTSAETLGPEDDIILAALRRHVLWTTLLSFDTSIQDDPVSTPQTRPAPTTVRRALEFIDENAHLPITIDDIAAAAFISTRGLQYAFRRTLDTTPADRLRRARLEGARREIRSGSEKSIALIARRWGFAHASRFAAACRAAYGRSPAADAGRRAE